MPEESYNNLFIKCFARGEDGNSDALAIESFTYNGNSIKLDNNEAGPLKIEAGIAATFYVRFKRKEKMVLNLRMKEVRDSEVDEDRVS